MSRAAAAARAATVAASELLRVPCDLDLGDAEDREEAERLYVEQATALRDALVGADVVLDVWREPLGELVGSRSSRSITRSSSRSGCPRRGCCRPRSWPATRSSWSPRCAARARWPRAARRWGSPARSRTSPASTRWPTTPSAASRTSSRSPRSTRAGWPSGSSTRRRRSSGSSSSATPGQRLWLAFGAVRRAATSSPVIVRRRRRVSRRQRAAGARVQRRRRRARGDHLADPGRGARRSPRRRRADRRLRARRLRAGAGRRPNAAALRHPGAVSILSSSPRPASRSTSTLGTARVAWTAGGSLPIVQCVRVRRAGNVLSGLRIELLSITPKLPGDATCP